MSTRNCIPGTVEAHIGARLSPFSGNPVLLEDLDVEASLNLSSKEAANDDRPLRLSLVNDLKLLFAALGAGGSAVPLGDNSRTARLLANYAESLRDR
jgi:hypothetical protein